MALYSEDSVGPLAELLQPISLAEFNRRLGGELGAMDTASWRQATTAGGFKDEPGQVRRGLRKGGGE